MSKWRFPQSVKDAVANVWAHHAAEGLKLQRLVMARQNEIDESHVHDFPPSSQSTNIRTNSPVGTAVTAAAVLGAAGLGAAGMQMLGSKAAAVAPPAAAAAVEAAKAKVELFYNDPKRGLVPLSGAATEAGTTLTPSGATNK
ncbi:MAG: hypothetical protein AAFV88_14075 [Planctomycetota bacterium]